MKVETTCAQCNQTFTRERKHVNHATEHNKPQYCSKDCLKKSRERYVEVCCATCQKRVQRKLGTLKRSLTGNFFCSRTCATQLNNKLFKSGTCSPNWRGGRGSYRRMALKHYGSFCEICKYSIEMCLDVHHIDGNRKNNKIENLVVLCPTHHKEVHLGITSIRG